MCSINICKTMMSSLFYNNDVIIVLHIHTVANLLFQRKYCTLYLHLHLLRGYYSFNQLDGVVGGMLSVTVVQTERRCCVRIKGAYF